MTPRLPDSEYRSRYRSWEHRAVAEAKIGRPLRDDEHVHHLNGNRLDNRPENLEVVTVAEHGLRHTRHPTAKRCVVCDLEFVPEKSKRARQQTCGRPECKSELLRRRWAEGRYANRPKPKGRPPKVQASLEV